MNVFDLFEYNDPDPENEGTEKLRFHLKTNRFKSLAKPKLHKHSHSLGEQDVEETASMTKGMKSNHEAFKVQEARKSDYNFDIEDIKRLEQIKDLATLKTQAMALIAKPSAKPMRPEKVEWFRSALEQMNSPMKVIKLMYDLMLSGEGHQVIGSRGSMNPNSYRSRFGESDVAEGSGDAKYKIKSIGKDSKGDYYISPNTGKKVYKQAKVGDHETPSGEHKPKIRMPYKEGVAEGSLEEVSLDLAKRARDKAEHIVDMDYDDMRDRPYGYSEKQRSRFQRYIDKKEPRAKGDRDWDPPEQGVAEAKHFRTAYGWAGGANEKTGKSFKHPDQIKADREAKKQEKEKQAKEKSVAEGNEPRFLDDDFYAYDPATMEIKDTWGYKSVGRAHSEYRAQQQGLKVVSGMRAKSLGLHYPSRNETKQRLDAKCWTGYKKQGTKMKGGVRVNNCVPVEEENKGLYYNVNKRKKAGTSRPAGHPKAPTAQAWRDAAKTAKKNESVTPKKMMEELEEYLFELELAGYEVINETRP